jgi:hypothetical protein
MTPPRSPREGWIFPDLGQRRSRWLVLLAALALAACGKDPAPPLLKKVSPRLTERLGRGATQLPEAERRFKEAAVYLDGKPIGVIKHSELPPSLPRRSQRLLDGREVPRYRVLEYLSTLGVPLDRLRAAHFLGGRGRASIVAGDELRRHPETLLFSFSRGDSGKPRMHWPEEGIAVNTTIDTLSGLALYVDKEPPHYDAKAHEFAFADGKPIEGIPYAEREEALKGTRVYVDGLLVGAMRRRTLAEGMRLPGGSEESPRYALAAWLATMTGGASPQAVELIAGEDLLTRLDAAQWAEEQAALTFTLPRHSQGKLAVLLPPGDPARKAAASTPMPEAGIKVSAVLLHVKGAPPGAPLRPLAEILAAEGDGSKNDQGGGQKRGNGDGSGTARSVQSDEGD